eukprot:12845633-Heterocapsa_arctica.AAC.1
MVVRRSIILTLSICARSGKATLSTVPETINPVRRLVQQWPNDLDMIKCIYDAASWKLAVVFASGLTTSACSRASTKLHPTPPSLH